VKTKLISIVTPSYNQGEFLAATIESVISQAGDFHIDYIIMDGGSTDDSVRIIKKYEWLLQTDEWPVACKGVTLRWSSEKDKGQADAINKGFGLAKGDILGWLNSDDTYLPGAVSTVLERFRAEPDTAMIYGNAWYTGRDGTVTGRYNSEPFDMKRLAARSIICQPTVFLRREALLAVGKLDVSLHTCLDYDLWIRLGMQFGKRITFIEDYLATSRMYADNKTSSQRDRVYHETMLVAKRHFGYVPGVWIVHSILEVIQAPDMSLPAKIGKIARSRLYAFCYLIQPKTLFSVIRFLMSRIAKSCGYANSANP